MKTAYITALVFAFHLQATAADMITAREATNIAESVVAQMARQVDGAARPLPKYLHAIYLDSSYPDEAEAYYRRADGPFGGCSARRVGNVCERNYDWNFDESAEFVVRISAANGRFASIGVSTVGTNLTEEIVTSGMWSPFYKVLPGRTLDGINENGVFCEVNVVATNGSPWETEREGRDINSMGAVRWVLDHATDARSAADELAARVYVSPAMRAMGYSVHYAVCDATGTYVVEDGVVDEWTPDVPAVMTNFRVFQYHQPDPYGTGYERFDVLADLSQSITNAWFSKAYAADLPRPTEFAAPGIGTHDETDALRAWAEAHVVPNLPPKRGGRWWQTVHTSVYDLEEKTLRICVQETDDWYSFALPTEGTDEEEVREIVDAVAISKTDLEVAKKTWVLDPTEYNRQFYVDYGEYEGRNGWRVKSLGSDKGTVRYFVEADRSVTQLDLGGLVPGLAASMTGTVHVVTDDEAFRLDVDSLGNRSAVTVGTRVTTDTAPVWEADKAYAKGEFVSSNGVAYVCIAAATAGTPVADDTKWTKATIGMSSAASGQTVTAKGEASVALGQKTIARGFASIAAGQNSEARSSYSRAYGLTSTAAGNYAVADGEKAVAAGVYSRASGIKAPRASDYASSVWNGDADVEGYGSHGQGTFSVNPRPTKGGDPVTGFFVGERNLKDVINDSVAVTFRNGTGLIDESGAAVSYNQAILSLLQDRGGLVLGDSAASLLSDGTTNGAVRTGYTMGPSDKLSVRFRLRSISPQARVFGTYGGTLGNALNVGFYVNGTGNWGYAFTSGSSPWKELGSGIAATTNWLTVTFTGNGAGTKPHIKLATDNGTTVYSGTQSYSIPSATTESSHLVFFGDATATASHFSNCEISSVTLTRVGGAKVSLAPFRANSGAGFVRSGTQDVALGGSGTSALDADGDVLKPYGLVEKHLGWGVRVFGYERRCTPQIACKLKNDEYDPPPYDVTIDFYDGGRLSHPAAELLLVTFDGFSQPMPINLVYPDGSSPRIYGDSTQTSPYSAAVIRITYLSNMEVLVEKREFAIP